MRLSALCSITLPVVLMLFVLPRQSAAQNPYIFETLIHETSTSMLGSQSWFDVDRDGDLDVIQFGNSDNLSMLENTATLSIAESFFSTESETGVVTPRVDYDSQSLAADPLWLGDIIWTDVDRDGEHDLVMIGTAETSEPYTPVTTILLRDGASLSPSSLSLDGVYAGSADAADVDGDGDVDLLFAGLSASGIPVSILHLNAGDGTYTKIDNPIPGYAYGSVEFGDYDKDGDVDVLAMGLREAGTFDVTIYDNDGSGTYSAGVTLATDIAYGDAQWGDYNGDGNLDVLISGGRISPNILDGVLQIYLQNSGFSNSIPEQLGSAMGAARWADFDNDGDVDVIVAGGRELIGQRSIGRFYQQGAGITLNHVSNFSSAFPASVQIGDMDGDADIDLSITGLGNRKRATLIQYRNTSRLVNHPPSAPAANSATVDGGDVTLSWGLAEDVETASEGLTYALRIGTTPGGSDVVLPASETEDGRRLYARHGNMWQNTRWTLNLPNGTYYWAVQAVDNSYAGSPFSVEQSFTVTESGKGVVTGTEDPEGHLATGLKAVYPNPFARTTTVGYQMTAPGTATIAIYNVLGQKVRTLVEGSVSAGVGEASWDGRGDDGARAGAGVYLIRFVSGDVVETSSVVLQ